VILASGSGMLSAGGLEHLGEVSTSRRDRRRLTQRVGVDAGFR
jgi:hypothetical protein